MIFLVGHCEYQVHSTILRATIAEWFLMTVLIKKYDCGNVGERVFERDLMRVSRAGSGDEYVATLRRIINAGLSENFWTNELPDSLKSGCFRSKQAYDASLVVLNARALFSKRLVGEALDSEYGSKSAVKRHCLFPELYLLGQGEKAWRERRVAANFAYAERPDDEVLGPQSPSEYFTPLFEMLSPKEQEEARFWHALPEGWEEMDYSDFLKKRSVLMAGVIRAAFEKLRAGATID